MIAVHRGDPDTYAAVVERPDDGGGGAHCALLRRWARALTREARGGSADALELLFGVWQRSADTMDQGLPHRMCADVTRLAVGLGDTDRLHTLTTKLTEKAASGGNPRTAADALLCRGMAEEDPELLLRAAESHRGDGHPLHEGYAQEYAARAFAARGRADAARKALHAALAAYERLDAAWDARRAEQGLAAAGVRTRRRSRRGPRTGWAALTETERAIVCQVAQGRSNPDIGARMFLSPRTVQFHLSAIFAKLGIASRVELAVSSHQQTARDSRSPPRQPDKSDMHHTIYPSDVIEA